MLATWPLLVCGVFASVDRLLADFSKQLASLPLAVGVDASAALGELRDLKSRISELSPVTDLDVLIDTIEEMYGDIKRAWRSEDWPHDEPWLMIDDQGSLKLKPGKTWGYFAYGLTESWNAYYPVSSCTDRYTLPTLTGEVSAKLLQEVADRGTVVMQTLQRLGTLEHRKRNKVSELGAHLHESVALALVSDSPALSAECVDKEKELFSHLNTRGAHVDIESRFSQTQLIAAYTYLLEKPLFSGRIDRLTLLHGEKTALPTAVLTVDKTLSLIEHASRQGKDAEREARALRRRLAEVSDRRAAGDVYSEWREVIRYLIYHLDEPQAILERDSELARLPTDAVLALEISDPEVRAKLLAAAKRRRAEIFKIAKWHVSEEFQVHLKELLQPEFLRLYKDVKFAGSDERVLVAKLLEVGREIEAGRIPATAILDDVVAPFDMMHGPVNVAFVDLAVAYKRAANYTTECGRRSTQVDGILSRSMRDPSQAVFKDLVDAEESLRGFESYFTGSSLAAELQTTWLRFIDRVKKEMKLLESKSRDKLLQARRHLSAHVKASWNRERAEESPALRSIREHIAEFTKIGRHIESALDQWTSSSRSAKDFDLIFDELVFKIAEYGYELHKVELRNKSAFANKREVAEYRDKLVERLALEKEMGIIIDAFLFIRIKITLKLEGNDYLNMRLADVVKQLKTANDSLSYRLMLELLGRRSGGSWLVGVLAGIVATAAMAAVYLARR